MGKNTRKNSLSEKARGPRTERQPYSQPSMSSSESSVEDTTAAPASSSPKAQVSFFITQAQKAQLREKGYSDHQIEQMKPAEAHQILGIE